MGDQVDLTNCKTGVWHDVERINTMSQRMKIRMAHLGLNKKVMVVERLNKGPVIVKVSSFPKSPPLILGRGLATKVIITRGTKYYGDGTGKNLRGY